MSVPRSLFTQTPAEGQILARQLASELSAGFPAVEHMPDMLKTTAAARPAPEIIAAIYFHAISQANQGWTDRAT